MINSQNGRNPDLLQFITLISDKAKFKEVKVNEGFCCFQQHSKCVIV